MAELAISELVLWAESPDEARHFLQRVEDSGIPFPRIDRIFVAKRSGKVRANRYIGGEYYPTSNDTRLDVYDTTVLAPDPITSLVQWCTCDVMLSQGAVPRLVLEDTTHIVRMNLYQRFPRLARAASLGVPGIVLQGTQGLDLRLRGDRWAMHRYLQGFEAIARIHPAAPVLPIVYQPRLDEEDYAQQLAIGHIAAILEGDSATVEAQRSVLLDDLRSTLQDGVEGEVPPAVPSIDTSQPGVVVVRVGARPEKKSWREKGSGQMDPYVGLIAAAKYIYCYDQDGRQVKDMLVEYTHLPPDFWFFRNAKTTALYKTLPRLFADRENWLGDPRYRDG